MPWVSLSSTEGEPNSITLSLLKQLSDEKHDGETTFVITSERRPEDEDMIFDWAAVARFGDDYIGVEYQQSTHAGIMPLIRVSRLEIDPNQIGPML